MPHVKRMVEKVASMGQPALGLTDHGSMAGIVQLYLECKAAGILPFPGMEAYLLDPNTTLEDKKAGRYHFGLLALNLRGYRALIRAMNLSHTRPRFNRFPRLTLDDVLELGRDYGDSLVLTTGCYFGYAQQALVNQGETAAEGVIKTYAAAYPNTFVEIQHHNITHNADWDDDEIVNNLVGIAGRLSLPVLACQDSHYVEKSEREAHALMKRMVYGGLDDEFPGDSFHLASEKWVSKHYTPDTWAKALDGSRALLDLHDLTMPALDTYKARVPTMEKNPDRLLAKLCIAALKRMDLDTTKHRNRLAVELGVIGKVGMANYFLLVNEFRKACKVKGVCIEVRGSANSALTLYVLGVTSVDPIKYKLLFDRFLAEDRIGPPDVDIDIEDAYRDWAVSWWQQRFPGSMSIGTFAALGIRKGDDRGSAVITWKSYRNRLAKADGKTFQYGWVQSVADVARIFPKDAAALRDIDRMNSVCRSYGTHASGILLPGDSMPIEKYVPWMLIPRSGTVEMHVSQFDQDDVEKLGFLKIDLLGQNTLTAMRICQQMIGRQDPTDFSWIPNDDREACKLLRSGRTDTGLFHYGGWTKATGAKRMGVKSTDDAILAIALFMPGAMDTAPGMSTSQTDLYLQRRADPEARRKVRYLHPAFEQALKETYGAVIYQEQVINIMRGLGMGIASVNKFFKVVKDSGKGATARNAQRMAEVRDEFDHVCAKEGIDADRAWAMTASFVTYSFNKSHASGYGIRAYRTAYLKAHHPEEFMAALLQSASGNPKNEVLYTREARFMGIRIMPPDVNRSGAIWTLDKQGSRKVIRRGLLSVKGVGLSAAKIIEQNAPYASIDDMIERLPGRPVSGGKSFADNDPETLTGVLKALHDAGAMDRLEEGN